MTAALAPASIEGSTCHYEIPVGTPAEIANGLARQFELSAAARDRNGGTPKAERDALRQSGLLTLSIPNQYGGQDADWRVTLDTVREIATADSSVAHIYGFHHLLLATVRLFGQPEQWEPWLEQTTRNQWFWGNTLNPLDTRTIATRHAGWWEFSGKKSFCSGAIDSQMLLASAVDAQTRRLLIAAIPSERGGITLNHDWDNIGQRQTDSGSALFEKVRIEQHELLLNPGPLSSPYSCLRPLLAQLVFAHLFLGIAQGALRQARDYTLNEAHPWFRSNADSSSRDPYTLHRYGDFWVRLEGARLLTEQAATAFQAAWEQGATLGERQRGETAIAVSTAKVATIQAGQHLTTHLFDVAGARATHAALGLDRFWRNLRTQSLHDPIDYKLAEIGDWALNGEFPEPSFYS